MTAIVLWLALGLLMIASLIPKRYKWKLTTAGAGWGLFSVHLASLTPYYYNIGDYVNVALTLIASFVGFIVGYVLVFQDKNVLNQNIIASLCMATTAAAVGGLTYFLFSEIQEMHKWLISTVVNQTIWLASLLGITITRMDWNIVAVNGYRVEIILACTAIESIALFTGIIASVRAPFKRLASAFLVSVPVIYVLNLIRNIFVVNAYGMLWFGNPETSFYIAHTIIAKTGSLIALFIISHVVLKILPEIIDMIDGILKVIRGIFNAG